MKVVHFSTTDYGGAYEAAQRISDSMRVVGIDSHLIVRSKYRKHTDVKCIFNNQMSTFISKIKNFLNLLVSEGEVVIDQFGTNILFGADVKEADVICLHWVNSFISVKEVYKLTKMGKRVYWIMHDMWPFTGGCHYAGECLKYKEQCMQCPMTSNQRKITRWNRIKKASYQMNNLIIVGPSRWITECASTSTIFTNKQIYTIHNPIDIQAFYPKKSDEVSKLKKRYSLSENKTTILFSAAKVTNNPIKGFDYFVAAMQQLPSDLYQILVVGKSDGCEKLKTSIQMEIIEQGFVEGSERLCEIYNAADILVAPSLEENYSNTVLESLACGTPAVVFQVGGMPDLVIHKENGYLARKGCAEDLAEGIIWLRENMYTAQIKAREYVLKNNTYEFIGQKYKNLFETER